MKLENILLAASAGILLIDIIHGYQVGALNKSTPTFDATLGAIEAKVPILPLWAWVGALGLGMKIL